jgi:ubiquitin-activating enzyme E1 C
VRARACCCVAVNGATRVQVEYALQVVWPKERATDKLDKDNPQHMLWLFDVASRRAAEFGIQGVTLKKTQGVVKHIIPAIAATNATIAAAEVNEALKYVTGIATSLDNYMMYNGVTGTYTHTFEYARNEACAVCGSPSVTIDMLATATVADLIEQLKTDAQ